MLRFRRMRSLQKFATVHASVCNHFNQDRRAPGGACAKRGRSQGRSRPRLVRLRRSGRWLSQDQAASLKPHSSLLIHVSAACATSEPVGQ